MGRYRGRNVETLGPASMALAADDLPATKGRQLDDLRFGAPGLQSATSDLVHGHR